MQLINIIIFSALSLFFTYSSANKNVNPDSDNSGNKSYYYKLDNGLNLVVKPDNKAPTVIHMVWYKVGSIDEVSDKTGLSHIVEHMMFKGTKKYPQFSKLMVDLGAKENAFTNSSYTVYHQQIPSQNLKQTIYMEADRMRNLELAKSDNFRHRFEKELQVIQEERRLRVDNQPESKLYEQLLAQAYTANGTRTPTVGWMDDIYNTKLSDVKNWYNKYYHPNNASVVVVGNANPDEVYKWVKDAYSSYKAEENSIVHYNRKEPEQEGKRTVELYSKQISDPSLYMLYKTPSYEEKPRHILALTLFSTLLSGYDYAYLDKKLVKQDKLLSSISTSQSLIQRSMPHFMIYAKPYNNADKIADIIQENILNFSKNITEAELNRAKKQWTADNVHKKDSLLNTAMELGVAYSNNYSYTIFDKIQLNILKISVEDIQEAVNLYFNSKHLTIGTLVPENSGKAK